MKTINFENSKINKLEVSTSIPTEIKVSGSTTIDSLDIKPVATNFDGNRVKLTGDFKDTQIQISSSCTLESGEKFYLNNNNKIKSIAANSIINPLGDFGQVSGIIIGSSCNIVTTEIETISHLNIFINIEDLENKNVCIIGDFSGCDFYIESKCFVNLDGKINNLIVRDTAKDTNISLSPNSQIKCGTVDSMIYISGQEDDMKKFIEGVVSGKSNVINLNKGYIIPIVNGQGTINFSINKASSYKISAYIEIDNKKVNIGEPVIFDIYE